MSFSIILFVLSSLLLLFLGSSLTVHAVPSIGKLDYSCIDIDGQIEQCPGNQAPAHFDRHLVAYARYFNRINQTGWAELEIVSNEQLDDSIQAYFAGYLEAFITANLIESHRANLLAELDAVYCRQYSQFIQLNLNWTLREIDNHPNDPYWKQIAASIYQINGMNDGYIAKKTKKGQIRFNGPHLDVDPCGIYLINLYTELEDIDHIIKSPHLEQPEMHCSALIKLAPNNRDLLIAHNTWANPKIMLRMMKRITLNLRSSQAKTVVMSSYPGTIFSVDDFYLTSQQLAITETTNENWNDSLWNGLGPQNIVMEFLRTMAANRLAQNGWKWYEYFQKLNSGTYNDQFMILDYKLFTPGQPLKDGLLLIVEQLPKIVWARDVTKILRQQSYWPSYNIPYIEAIYNLSGYGEQREKYGDFYSYEDNARARIFRRDHAKVTNLTTLFSLMRYNDFRNDPLSRCQGCKPGYTGEYAIAARDDLNDPNGTYPDRHLGFRPVAALDAKMTNNELIEQLQMVAVSGPTDQKQPPFSWATTKLRNVPHRDQPIEWTFKPVLVSWHNQTTTGFDNFKFDL